MAEDFTQVLQDIYDSEINIKIEWFWDGGMEAHIGDEMNGWKDKVYTSRGDIKELMRHLVARIIRVYPRSGFAKKYADKVVS